jgi:carboxymethylenebutenolidase
MLWRHAELKFRNKDVNFYNLITANTENRTEQAKIKYNKKMSETLSQSQQAMLDIFQQHVNAELLGDIETTMATMTDNPYLNHVPVMAGGVGKEGVRDFYTNHLVGKFFPPDVKMTTVSRTIGLDQIVEELVISFTHTTPIDFVLPGVEPTGKRVLIAFVVIVGFKDGKISHEHIYWDQASVLAQVGLLKSSGLPVCGAESSRKVLDPNIPYHVF